MQRLVLGLCVAVILGFVLVIIHHVFGSIWWIAAGSIIAGVIGLVCIVGSQYEDNGQAELTRRRISSTTWYVIACLVVSLACIAYVGPGTMWKLVISIFAGPVSWLGDRA